MFSSVEFLPVCPSERDGIITDDGPNNPSVVGIVFDFVVGSISFTMIGPTNCFALFDGGFDFLERHGFLCYQAGVWLSGVMISVVVIIHRLFKA